MLHEIIVTLLGKSSTLLRSLNSYIDLKPFLQPFEIDLLEEILIIARDFKLLQDFINLNRFTHHDTTTHVIPGLYIQTFSEALDDVLNAYRQEVMLLENKVLSSQSTVTLLFINSCIEPYRLQLSSFCSLIHDISTMKIHGCRILQLLSDATITVTNDVKPSIDYILKKCHGILLKQITNWLLNGTLIDPYNEFFIANIIPDKSELFSICTDADAEEECLQKQEIGEEEYTIVARYIPTYIPYSLVNDILFIGKIVRILNKNAEFKYVLSGGLNEFVFKNKQSEFYHSFESFLKNQTFEVADLEKAVWEIKSCVVEYLWKVAVEDHKLFNELQLIKNFYLLGHADIFIDLLKNFNVFIKIRASKYLIKYFNCYLRESEYITQMLDDTVLEKFNFCLLPTNNTGSDNSNKSSKWKIENAWSSIMLEYRTCWPLNLLFTRAVMLRYNKLFTFLLRIKKCHLNIHQTWVKEIKNKSNRKFEQSWKLLNELMFLISNLQFYLQVDVIEAEYTNFIENIRQQRDFQQVIRLHNLFLLSILNQSFIFPAQAVDEKDLDQSLSNIKPHKVYIILCEIFQICEKFCAIMMKKNMPQSQKVKEFQTMANNFTVLRSALTSALLALQFQPFRGNLSKLLLRLDMNEWFTKSSVIPLQV